MGQTPPAPGNTYTPLLSEVGWATLGSLLEAVVVWALAWMWLKWEASRA
jgi:hypothetical protein